MSGHRRLAIPMAATSALVLATCGLIASAAEPGTDDSGAYTPLALENRPTLDTGPATHNGTARIGLGYTSQDNYMFGEYNGLSKQGVTAIGDLQWQDFHNSDNYWQLSLSNLGLDTREGELVWGRVDHLKLTVGFDSQQQVRNDSGQTPFRGNATQYSTSPHPE